MLFPPKGGKRLIHELGNHLVRCVHEFNSSRAFTHLLDPLSSTFGTAAQCERGGSRVVCPKSTINLEEASNLVRTAAQLWQSRLICSNLE